MTNLRFVEDVQEDINVSKKRFRAYMKEVRSAIDNRDVKEELLQKKTLSFLEEHSKTVQEKKVFVYLSFSSEASTDTLIDKLLKRGYDVYCPRTENGVMTAVSYGEDFTLSAFGTREPIGETLTVAPDFVIIPLLAVDKQGNRLGYGKGFYDAYLRKYPTAKRIGYCFSCQIRKEIPHTEQDEKLDVIISEDGVQYVTKT